MISISHWGMFPVWASMPLAPLQCALAHGFARLYWHGFEI